MNRLLQGIFLLSFSIIIFQLPAGAQTAGNPAPLPNRTMISLSGDQKHNLVELKGILSASHSYDKMIIERGDTPGSFEKIGEMNIAGTASSAYHFTYDDMSPGNGVNYYRIKLQNSITKVNEITHTLMVKMDNEGEGLELVNTVLQSGSPVITVTSNEDAEAALETMDIYGRLIRTENARLNNGTNNITLTSLANSKGFFVVVVRTKKKVKGWRVLVQ